QLQNKADNGTSILSQDPGVYAGKFDRCRLAEILRSCHEQGITFTRNKRLNDKAEDDIARINTIQQVLKRNAKDGLEWNNIEESQKSVQVAYRFSTEIIMSKTTKYQGAMEEVQKKLMEIIEKTEQLKQKMYKVNMEVIEKRVDEIIPKSKQVVIEINQHMAGSIEKQRVKEIIKR
ncbi:13785_t:CDS:2, partial [Gigaspora rosea]